MLEEIKLLTSNYNDELITLLIDKTKKEIETYCGIAYAETMDNLIVDLVVFKINTLNTQGISGQSYNGISESYLIDYPPYILRQLDTFKKRCWLI